MWKFTILSTVAIVLVSVAVLSQATSAKSATEPLAEPIVELQWIGVPSTGLRSVNTFRARVPGGWLVTTAHMGGQPVGTGMAFVPDPNHSWNFNNAKVEQESEEK